MQPKALPKNWILGQVSGVAVDAQDHVWIIHRPGTLSNNEKAATTDPPTAECCVPAPPVIEFDAKGNVVRAWGGPGAGYEWPTQEHGIAVDHKGNVWVSASAAKDAHVVKFTSDGKFLLQIGRLGQGGGNNDTANLGRPAEMRVDPATNEVYVADGENGGNRRVIVFDADTGAYKRHWGAYGEKPDDGPPPKFDPDGPLPKQFGSAAVHCVRIAKDGLVYVCDRGNNRIQVFRRDGTFVNEAVVARPTRRLGSVWDIEFSPDQQFLYVADGTNMKLWILRRSDLQIVGAFGRMGRNAGQFLGVNALGVDSHGSIFTGEVSDGRRVQKFVFKGLASRSGQ
jgi:DNA-binding beta-propeller fold protein YncE